MVCGVFAFEAFIHFPNVLYKSVLQTLDRRHLSDCRNNKKKPHEHTPIFTILCIVSLVSICHAPLSPTPSCKYLHPAVPVPATSGHCNKISKRKTLKQKYVFGFIILEILTLSQLVLSPWICGETENHDGGDRGNGSGHGDQEAESSVALTGRFPSPSRPPSYRTGLPIFKADLSPCNFCLICQSPLGTPSKIFPEACFTKLLGASSPGKLPIKMNPYTPYF